MQLAAALAEALWQLRSGRGGVGGGGPAAARKARRLVHHLRTARRRRLRRRLRLRLRCRRRRLRLPMGPQDVLPAPSFFLFIKAV